MMMAAKASLSPSFASLMNWSTLALSNHMWQICAMESEVFNKRPGPLIKGLLKKKRGEEKRAQETEGLSEQVWYKDESDELFDVRMMLLSLKQTWKANPRSPLNPRWLRAQSIRRNDVKLLSNEYPSAVIGEIVCVWWLIRSSFHASPCNYSYDSLTDLLYIVVPHTAERTSAEYESSYVTIQYNNSVSAERGGAGRGEDGKSPRRALPGGGTIRRLTQKPAGLVTCVSWPNPEAQRHRSISVTFDGPGLKQIYIPLVDFKRCLNNDANQRRVNEACSGLAKSDFKINLIRGRDIIQIEEQRLYLYAAARGARPRGYVQGRRRAVVVYRGGGATSVGGWRPVLGCRIEPELLLSREAQAQTQTWSRTSVGSHVFITVFVLMMSSERDGHPPSLPLAAGEADNCWHVYFDEIRCRGEAPTVCSSHGTPIWSLAELTTKRLDPSKLFDFRAILLSQTNPSVWDVGRRTYSGHASCTAEHAFRMCEKRANTIQHRANYVAVNYSSVTQVCKLADTYSFLFAQCVLKACSQGPQKKL
ncbi:hypothetical protein D9C73_003875 [Collichthys lucidus]|uniref:Uncharacterized protein n=1 Tax=Collichthys lucidus TaxID=240159 RepID=A0A4U5U7I4_COLLU|nr:hypothetical protein D9C73_003875 [Collichthys lucidus]